MLFLSPRHHTSFMCSPSHLSFACISLNCITYRPLCLCLWLRPGWMCSSSCCFDRPWQQQVSFYLSVSPPLSSTEQRGTGCFVCSFTIGRRLCHKEKLASLEESSTHAHTKAQIRVHCHMHLCVMLYRLSLSLAVQPFQYIQLYAVAFFHEKCFPQMLKCL